MWLSQLVYLNAHNLSSFVLFADCRQPDNNAVLNYACVAEILSSRPGRKRDLLLQIERKLRHQPAHAQRLPLLPLPEVLGVGNVAWRYVSLSLSVCCLSVHLCAFYASGARRSEELLYDVSMHC